MNVRNLKYCPGPHGNRPIRMTEGSAGHDLRASEDVLIKARGRALISTDISIELPTFYYGRICPRSSLAVNHGIDVGAGIIDTDYRGEIKVLLFNHSDEDYQVIKNARIAQLVIQRILYADFKYTENKDMTNTERGQSGFGSTGAL